MLILADVLVTGTEVLRPGWVHVEAGQVIGLGAGCHPSIGDNLPTVHRVAAVVPAFVDIHVHGGGAGAFPDADPDQTRMVVDLHRRHGTGSLLASLVSAHPADLLRQVAVLADQVADGVIAGIHLEGPWLSARRCGAHDPAALRDPDPVEIAAVLAAGRGTIRMVTIAPERPGGLEVIRQLVEAGVVAAVGHTNASYEQTRAAIEAGATVATHLFNAMRPVHHREPGPVVALLEDPRVTIELIHDGVHLHPALYRDVTARVGADRVALITDAMAAAGMADGDYRLGSLAVQVRAGVARVAGTDTIAGSTATMDRVFRMALLHGAAGQSPDRLGDLIPDQRWLTAVRQSSVNPARALGLADPGLRIGGPATLVCLDRDLQVVADQPLPTDELRAGV